MLRRIEPGTFIMGDNPSEAKGETRPVEKVSWNMIRGDSAVHDWPKKQTVAADSFAGRLRARTGLDFDLPTEAQWEYACRAGTTGAYNNGGDAEDDLHGDVWEWCRDWLEGALPYGEDPVGVSSGSHRVLRGGSWNYFASGCASSYRGGDNPSNEGGDYGFRLFCSAGSSVK